MYKSWKLWLESNVTRFFKPLNIRINFISHSVQSFLSALCYAPKIVSLTEVCLLCCERVYCILRLMCFERNQINFKLKNCDAHYVQRRAISVDFEIQVHGKYCIY